MGLDSPVLTCHHRAGAEAYVVYRHASRALFRAAVSLFPVSSPSSYL